MDITHVIYGVNKRIITGITHCQPIEAEEKHVYVLIPVKMTMLSLYLYQPFYSQPVKNIICKKKKQQK